MKRDHERQPGRGGRALATVNGVEPLRRRVSGRPGPQAETFRADFQPPQAGAAKAAVIAERDRSAACDGRRVVVQYLSRGRIEEMCGHGRSSERRGVSTTCSTETRVRVSTRRAHAAPL